MLVGGTAGRRDRVAERGAANCGAGADTAGRHACEATGEGGSHDPRWRPLVGGRRAGRDGCGRLERVLGAEEEFWRQEQEPLELLGHPPDTPPESIPAEALALRAG